MKFPSTVSWKKSLLRAGSVLVVLTMVSVALVFTRFNFSWEEYAQLAWLQKAIGVNQPVSSATGVVPQIIGHRGSGLIATDGNGLIGNTKRAIRRGIDANADWIELDIRQSKDGILMVFHDETVDRTTNSKGKLDSYRQAELQSLQLKVDPVETIATLEEVFQEFSSDGVHFILDIKVRGIRGRLLALVKKYFSQDQIILFGVYDVLQEYAGCGYKMGYTALWSEGWNKYRLPFEHSFIVKRCNQLGCHYLILPTIFLNQSLIDDSRAEGLEVWTYGSENKQDWNDCAHRGITGLIVDHPEVAVQAFRSP